MALCHKSQSALRNRKRNRMLMYRDHRPCAMVSIHQSSRSVPEDADTGINIDGLGHKHQSAISRRSLKERKGVQRTVSKSDVGNGKVRMRGSLPSHPGSLCRLLLEIEAEVWLVCRMSLAAYSKQATFPLALILYIIMFVFYFLIFQTRKQITAMATSQKSHLAEAFGLCSTVFCCKAEDASTLSASTRVFLLADWPLACSPALSERWIPYTLTIGMCCLPFEDLSRDREAPRG